MNKQILACKSYFIHKKRILSVFVFCCCFLFICLVFFQPNVMRKKLSESAVFNEKCWCNLKKYYRLLIRTDVFFRLKKTLTHVIRYMSWSLIYIDSTTSQMYASVKWISAAVGLYQITQHTRHGIYNNLNDNTFLRFWLLHLVCAAQIFLTLDKFKRFVLRNTETTYLILMYIF
jgi:hypothetical protein